MNEIVLSDAICMFDAVADEMIAKEKYFCELDSGLGDGDHGVTVSRGWKAAKQVLSQPQKNLEMLFDTMGSVMAASMGGAVGPIYALMLEGFAKAVSGKNGIDLHTAAAMFAEAVSGIEMGADVEEGQKTLLDALAPGARALKRADDEGEMLLDGFEAAREAAQKGAGATVDMVAKKGRARFLREKSIGHMDAGAGSMAALIAAMSDFLTEKGGETER